MRWEKVGRFLVPSPGVVPHMAASPPAMATTSFPTYRLNAISTYGASYGVREFRLYESVGGANALTGGTASSSSGTAANAFDGNTSSACIFTTVPAWVQMTKNSALVPRYLWALYPSSSATPTSLTVQGSNDGTNFTTLFSDTSGQFQIYDANGTYQNTFPMTGEAWRLEINSVRGGGTTAKLTEWQLLSELGANRLAGGIPFASSSLNHTVNAPDVLFDGSSSTYWQNAPTYNAVGAKLVYLGYIQPDASDTVPAFLSMTAYSSLPNDIPSNVTLKKMPKGSSTWITIGTYDWTSGNTAAFCLLANPPAIWDFTKKGTSITLSGGNLVATNATGSAATVLAMRAVSGKKYWELVFSGGSYGSNTSADAGAALSTFPINSALHNTSGGLAYGCLGGVYRNGVVQASSTAWGDGAVIGIELDANALTCSVYLNNVFKYTITGLSGTYYPACSVANGVTCTARFTSASQSYPTRSGGFTALGD